VRAVSIPLRLKGQRGKKAPSKALDYLDSLASHCSPTGIPDNAVDLASDSIPEESFTADSRMSTREWVLEDVAEFQESRSPLDFSDGNDSPNRPAAPPFFDEESLSTSVCARFTSPLPPVNADPIPSCRCGWGTLGQLLPELCSRSSSSDRPRG